MRIGGNAKTNDKNRRVAFQTCIDTCAPRTINKAPTDGSGHTDIWSILSRICSWKQGKTRGATIWGGKFASRSMISGIVDAIPHFPRRRFARRAYVPIVCGTHRYAHYGVASYRRSAHGFHPRETLPSATRPCCGRRSCPVSRCPVFGYGTDCSL